VSVPAVLVPDAGTTLIASSTTVKATTLNKKMMRFISATFPSSSAPYLLPLPIYYVYPTVNVIKVT
jgi:hypothetical protein